MNSLNQLTFDLDAARYHARLNYLNSAPPPYGEGYNPELVQAEFNADHARHAAFVLRGTYDAQVLAGRPTLTVNGEMPVVVAEAHAERRAALGA